MPFSEKYGPALVIYGGAHDNVPGCTHPVNDGDVIEPLGPSIKIKALHTPCHTKGHILYYCESADATEESKESMSSTMEHDGKYQHVKSIDKCLFTGDTMFLGGCGKFFEGTSEQMLSAFDRISELPDETKIFCGHEYTLSNFKFALLAEPHNPKIHQYYQHF